MNLATGAPPPPSALKRQWRMWARSVRRAVSQEVSQEVVSKLGLWLESESAPQGWVVVYSALPDEVDLSGLGQLTSRHLAVTRTPAEGLLTIHPVESSMERHPYGFSQPKEGSPPVEMSAVEVVFVPGLAFDSVGNRLGRGVGFYDRFLSALGPSTARVGVTTERLVVDAIPIATHDEQMTHLATEKGVREVGMLNRD